MADERASSLHNGRFADEVPEEIEKIQAPHIKEFLNGCKVGPRRWNNLRDQVVTLFRSALSERYLPKDRTTEAEDVAKMKVARKTVEVFTSEELKLSSRTAGRFGRNNSDP